MASRGRGLEEKKTTERASKTLSRTVFFSLLGERSQRMPSKRIQVQPFISHSNVVGVDRNSNH